MVGWLIAVIIIGSIVSFVLFLRFVFVSRRLKKSSRETALSRVPTIFGTLAPNAIHQKIHIKRIREHPPVVLTPGTRLGQSIRIPKFSFNFGTLYSRFRIELDELDALDDVEAQYDVEPDEEVAAKPPKPKDIYRIWRDIFPCFKSSKYKIGVEELIDPEVPDDNSIEPNSAWVKEMHDNADLNSVDSGSIEIIDTKTGTVVNSAILDKKRDRGWKKKRIKKPKKILTKREQVAMFMRHMEFKKQKKKILREKSLGSWNDLDSLDRGSIESTSDVRMQDLANDFDMIESDIPLGVPLPLILPLHGEGETLQYNDNNDDTNLLGNNLEHSDMLIDDIHDTKADNVMPLPPSSSYFVNQDDTLGPESEMEGGEYSDIKFGSPQSAYAGLTVGFHTTVSHGDSRFGGGVDGGGFGGYPAGNQINDPMHHPPSESYRVLDWDSSSIDKMNFVPEVNVACAQYRLQRRAMRKQWVLETTGVRDTTDVNGGPPLSMIPAGYEISGALLSMDHHEIAYQLIMYLFDGDRDIAKGWFVGTLIGLSMIREGNYHVRFDVHQTNHRKVHGIYKLDLALEGINAYGKRWVILVPTAQGIDTMQQQQP